MKIDNNIVLRLAEKYDFDLVGFAEYSTLDEEVENLNKWLNLGFNAGMKYMERNREKRRDIKNIFPQAKSVISLGMNYYTHEEYSNEAGKGKVSRFAWGRDYHYVMWEKLEEIIVEIKKLNEEFEAIYYVDTGPLLDKAWAVKAGIGWLGKHSNVISREIGSWFFIANIITNVDFDYSEVVTDHCGSCTACLDACPTEAIVEDYVVDSSKCISYLTIENKGEIPGEFNGKFENWIFGCDICQEVCPWNNKFWRESQIPDFRENLIKVISLDRVDSLSEEEFKSEYGNSPIKRAKLNGLKRNSRFLSPNDKSGENLE